MQEFFDIFLFSSLCCSSVFRLLMFIMKNVKNCRADANSMNNCYYRDFEWRENRGTKPEVRSSKVDKRNGALCTQREHALASSKGERYKLSAGKGEKKRDKMAEKSRRMLHFSRVILPRCHLAARYIFNDLPR